MKLWKSLLVGFGSYIILTFLGNLLVAWATPLLGISGYFALDIWSIITSCFTGLDGLNPVSFEIYTGMATAVVVLPLGTSQAYITAIGGILVPIIPGLVAAILAGKFGRTPFNGFFGMLITGILISVFPIVMVFVNNSVFDSFVPLASAVVNNPYLEAAFAGSFGVLIGAFWGGLAAFFGRE